ncbi:MAG: acyltransferase [Actinobacteria bacterium]|nr:acyltransferase [Actinomycetota bacterium]
MRPPRVRAPLGIAAAAAGAILVALCVTLSAEQTVTYRGGLALAALSALVIVVACTGPGPVGTALSRDPLQWLGTRSYAIYLWSWPIQLLLQERWPDVPLAVVAIVTVGASLVLAEASMRLVENPLRFRAGWARPVTPRRAAWAFGVVALLAAGFIATRSTVETQAEQIAHEFAQVPDPTTTMSAVPASLAVESPAPAPTTAPPTTVCIPTTVAAPQFSGSTTKFDPRTVGDVADPNGTGCGATRVLVVGDSTGRGAANGLRRNAPDTLEVWDRTVLGCGMQANRPKCPSWRDLWPTSVRQLNPQVVLVHLGVSTDLVAGSEPPFLSPEASQQRQQVLGDAMDALRAGGARVVWALPAVPLDQGTFYCGGTRRNTGCDPAWILQWDKDVIAAASTRGVTVVDLDSWVASRGRNPADRGDGLHFSGAGLDAEALWLAPQLR